MHTLLSRLSCLVFHPFEVGGREIVAASWIMVKEARISSSLRGG